MKIIETALLLIAYSTSLITIFVGILCYKRNIEKLETIAFSISVLLLIVSMTTTYLFEENSPDETANIFILLSMILLGLTTPLSVMTERKHSISINWIKALYWFFGLLFAITCFSYFINKLYFLEYVIAGFLGISVAATMILAIVTKPQDNFSHLEKTNKIFSIAFLILVPISLAISSFFPESAESLKIGFVPLLIFILLAANKLMDDLQRLSFIKVSVDLDEQHFKNYALSKRETEVARLLAQGKTYKQISEELFISLPTVKTHSSNIYKKCKVNNRHELTILLTS